MTRFIGIDFSTTRTGVAIFDTHGLQTHSVKSAPSGDGLLPYYWRVRMLAENVLSIVDPRAEDVIAIESPIVMGRRTDTEIRLHYAWHRFAEALLMRRMGFFSETTEPFLVPPAQVKQLALGGAKRLRGRAGKAQMVAAAREAFGDVLRNDDEADAVWVAVGASILHGEPVIDLPPEHVPEGWKSAA